MRDRSGKRRGVIEFVHRPTPILHARRCIDQQRRAQIRFLFILFDKMPIGAGISAPIQALQIVAGRVFPVVGELD
jgi:hypothetical protein